MKSKPPFDLPDEPIDGHVITFFTVLVFPYDVEVVEVKLVYHEHTLWKDIVPPERGGAPALVDQWQVFSNGVFCARRNGWRGALIDAAGLGWEYTFATREEALRGAIDSLVRSRQRLVQRNEDGISKIDARLKELRGGGGTLAEVFAAEAESSGPTPAIVAGLDDPGSEDTKGTRR